MAHYFDVFKFSRPSFPWMHIELELDDLIKRQNTSLCLGLVQCFGKSVCCIWDLCTSITQPFKGESFTTIVVFNDLRKYSDLCSNVITDIEWE